MAGEPGGGTRRTLIEAPRRRRYGWLRGLLAVAGGGVVLIGLYLASVAILGSDAAGAAMVAAWFHGVRPQLLTPIRWSLYAVVLLVWPRLAAGLARRGAGWDGHGPQPSTVRHLYEFLLALRRRAVVVLIVYEALFVFRLHAVLVGALQ